jgi:DNA-binding CsgD family transcriptional regulator
MNLTDEDAIAVYMKVSEKVLHLRRLGMTYTNIAERLGINPWMVKKAARWGKTHLKRRENTSPY